MNRDLKNYVAIVLDRSTSMDSIRHEVVDALNEQIKVIKKGALEQPTRVSFVTFSTDVDEPKFWNQRSTKLKPVLLEEYKPSGMTAMYDAVGDTVTKLSSVEDAHDPNTSFLVVVVSDGDENHSRKYDSKKLAGMIKELQGTDRCTFMYIGANQDLTKISEDLGIHSGNTYSFTASSHGAKGMSLDSSRSIGGYFNARSQGFKSMVNAFDGDAPELTTTGKDVPVTHTSGTSESDSEESLPA